MKCPSCQTYVTKIPVNWKCPHCGERLPDPSRWYILYTNGMEFLQDKGAIFWSVWFGVFLLVVGVVEVFFGTARLLSYLGNSLLMSIIGIFFTGMLIDMVMKFNLPLRLQMGTDFIIKERKVIRNLRKATNLAALAGFIYAVVWAGPAVFLSHFPAYSVIIGWFLVMAWSAAGLFLDPKMADDVRFRAYMERLGVTSLRRYRKVGTVCIGIMVSVAITYHVLASTSGLWVKFSRLAVVTTVFGFLKQYFSWLF